MVPNNANTFLPPTPVTPGFLVITAITNAINAVITITNSVENTYIPGQLVYFSVPVSYGMQINGITGQITAINGTLFTTDVNTTQLSPFVVPPDFKTKPATISPAGSRNLQFNNTTDFVPFKSLNNQGN